MRGEQGWIGLGLLAALFAGLVGVVGKRGLEEVDPTLGTAIRATIMALFLVGMTAVLGKLDGVRRVSPASLGWIALSGVCGALSWLCYFGALRLGKAAPVAALDRLSIVFTLLLAAVLLRERVTPQSLGGAALIVAGALLVARGAR